MKFSSLIRFPRKKSTKRSSRTNSSISISEDMHEKVLSKGRPFRISPVTKRFGDSRTSHVGGRSKGHLDVGSYQRHFKNDQLIKGKYLVSRKSSEESEAHHKTMQHDKLHKDSNVNSAFKTQGLKRPKLSNVLNSNFRTRFYYELNVLAKPIKPRFKSASRSSRLNPITMNKEQPLVRCWSRREGYFSTHTAVRRQSTHGSDDEDIFVLDI